MKSRKNILSKTIHLVWPNDVEYVTGLFTPLGVGYLASYLKKKGFDIIIHDRTFSKEIKAEKKRAIYGVSITTPIANLAMEVIKRIKKLNPENITIAGGPHATCVPEDLIKSRLVDYVVVGEGEDTLSELCSKLLGNESVKDVKGIYYKVGKGTHFTGPRQLIEDIDTIPFPLHELFPLEQDTKNRPIREMVIISSRGCPFNCEFCQPYLRNTFGMKIRYRSEKNVVDELEYVKKKHGAHIVVFNDDMVNPVYIKKVCDEIIRRGLKILWRCQARANLDKSLIRLMKRAGCIGIAFGVESGSQKVLDAVDKRLKVEDVAKVFRYCREIGIFTHAYLMVGNTSENMDDVRKTLELIRNIKPFSIGVSIATPYPGTHLFARLKKEGKLPEKIDWGIMHHMKNNTIYIKVSELSRDEVIEAKNMLMEEFMRGNKNSRFRYILSYMKDTDGMRNVFYFAIKNPGTVLSSLTTLIAISRTGSGFKYTNPKQSFYGKELEL